MAEQTREKTQRSRADARARRRASTSDENGNGAGPVDAAKNAARAAAAAAIAGGLAGAAKALVERRRRGDDEQDEEEQVDRQNDPEPSSDASDEAISRDPGTEDDGNEQEQRPEPQQPAAREHEADRPDDEGDGEPRRGGSSSEVARIVEKSRRHAADLLGRDAESVAGVSRGNGSWTVTLEVVDLRRIPDSTDVLSAYDVVMDDDGGLLDFVRRGRYLRSQVEEAR